MITEGQALQSIDDALTALRDHDEKAFERVLSWLSSKFMDAAPQANVRIHHPAKATMAPSAEMRGNMQGETLEEHREESSPVDLATARNPVELARFIKSHALWPDLCQTFFETPDRSRWRKVAGVLWVSRRGMTTGQIANTLDDLGYAIGPSGVSHTVTRYDFFRAVARRTRKNAKRYQLTDDKYQELARELAERRQATQ